MSSTGPELSTLHGKKAESKAGLPSPLVTPSADEARLCKIKKYSTVLYCTVWCTLSRGASAASSGSCFSPPLGLCRRQGLTSPLAFARPSPVSIRCLESVLLLHRFCNQHSQQGRQCMSAKCPTHACKSNRERSSSQPEEHMLGMHCPVPNAALPRSECVCTQSQAPIIHPCSRPAQTLHNGGACRARAGSSPLSGALRSCMPGAYLGLDDLKLCKCWSETVTLKSPKTSSPTKSAPTQFTVPPAHREGKRNQRPGALSKQHYTRTLSRQHFCTVQGRQGSTQITV